MRCYASDDMVCPLVLMAGILAACLEPIGGSTPACGYAGGKCINRYEGCVGGHFVVDLCGGPAYYQCCVIPPVIDYEALNRPKTRNCHECAYSVSRGRPRGSEECLTWKNGGEGSGSHPVNCTGMCSKELLRFDAVNYELLRRCNTDCHLKTWTSMHRVYCCWGDLCNAATPGGATGSITPALLGLAFIWTMYLGGIFILHR